MSICWIEKSKSSIHISSLLIILPWTNNLSSQVSVRKIMPLYTVKLVSSNGIYCIINIVNFPRVSVNMSMNEVTVM